MGANSKVNVGEYSFVHASLDSEVEDSLLIAIVDTGDTAEVTLLVVCFDGVYYRCRQVLHCRLCIAGHEFLSVNENLLDGLTVDLDCSVVADLGARKFLHEGFES